MEMGKSYGCSSAFVNLRSFVAIGCFCELSGRVGTVKVLIVGRTIWNSLFWFQSASLCFAPYYLKVVVWALAIFSSSKSQGHLG